MCDVDDETIRMYFVFSARCYNTCLVMLVVCKSHDDDPLMIPLVLSHILAQVP